MHQLTSFLSSDTGAWLALGLNAAGVFGFLIYGLGQGHLVWFYFKRGPATRVRPPLPESPADYPFVTVQLPMYNERYVAAAVIDACAALDWPAERLEIQVLDDSVDDTGAIIDERIAYWQPKGIDVKVVRRPQRTGYKAGALANGAPMARGEFHALFDADFRPHADFLKRTIPYFQDPGVGAVQARWGHLNRTYSWLTRAQAMVIDSFFIVEQEARDRAGLLIRFNGSAGIWRATTIVDAGGWHADTLAEDYDLCLRAQMKGWRFVYARDVVAPAELPVTMSDYKVQQTRWARGRGQVIRKLLPSLIRADLPPLVKGHALFDLLNIITVPSLLLVGLMSPWFALALSTHAELRPWGFVLGIVQVPLNVILVPIFIWHALRPYVLKVTSMPGEAVLSVPPFFSIMMGINLLMASAAISGLRGGSVVFRRTSKYNLAEGKTDWRAKLYRPSEISAVTWGEGAFAAYFVATIVLDFAIGAYLYLPFHLFLALGFGAMFVFSLFRA